MEQIQVFKDSKDEIEFWLKALENPNIDEDSIILLNKCLHAEINKHLSPMAILM